MLNDLSRAIRRINSSKIYIPWSCNWECLYGDSSRDIRWTLAWVLGKSFGLRLYFIAYLSCCHNGDTIWFNKHISLSFLCFCKYFLAKNQHIKIPMNVFFWNIHANTTINEDISGDTDKSCHHMLSKRLYSVRPNGILRSLCPWIWIVMLNFNFF